MRNVSAPDAGGVQLDCAQQARAGGAEVERAAAVDDAASAAHPPAHHGAPQTARPAPTLEPLDQPGR